MGAHCLAVVKMSFSSNKQFKCDLLETLSQTNSMDQLSDQIFALTNNDKVNGDSLAHDRLHCTLPILGDAKKAILSLVLKKEYSSVCKTDLLNSLFGGEEKIKYLFIEDYMQFATKLDFSLFDDPYFYLGKIRKVYTTRYTIDELIFSLSAILLLKNKLSELQKENNFEILKVAFSQNIKMIDVAEYINFEGRVKDIYNSAFAQVVKNMLDRQLSINL